MYGLIILKLIIYVIVCTFFYIGLTLLLRWLGVHEGVIIVIATLLTGCLGGYVGFVLKRKK